MIHLLALTNTAHYVQKAGLSLGGHGQDADEPGVNSKSGRCVSRTVNTTISRAGVDVHTCVRICWSALIASPIGYTGRA